MSHYALLGDYRFGNATEDIRGSALYGVGDEKLGKIQDVIYDHLSGDVAYVVVDTGGWLTTKEFVVSAELLRPSSEHEGDFACDMTKQQIESLPPYDEKDLESHEKWTDYENRYRAKWETSPVMHRKETDRNITPTTLQMEGNRSSAIASGNESGLKTTGVAGSRASQADPTPREAAEAPTGRIVPAGVDSVVISNSASGIGGRWDTFQARLRERRKESVASCPTCRVGPGRVSESESATDFKKAV
ncbi:MAG TPA: PRC-barrel domain-containing protein [Terriglobales bacterium]|nr:PRC-barrel domain-containing protein [Terriglobales bacterium]